VPGKFGLFEADLDQGTLSRQGVPVKLQEQPFRNFSSAARGTLRCAVEFDGSLNTALMKLRAASHKGYRVHRRRAHSDDHCRRGHEPTDCAFSSGAAFAGVVAGWEEVAVHADGAVAKDRFDVGDFAEWGLAAACASRRQTRPARGKRNVAGRWKILRAGVDLRASLAVDTHASLWLTKRLPWLAGFE
jgi:hypothetical protein